MIFFPNFERQRKDFQRKKKILKERKLCMQNLTKERKQPPVVILQQAIFTIYLFCACN